MIVGYGQRGTYKVVDPTKIRETGKISIVHMRDVRPLRNVYPMKEYKFESNFVCHSTPTVEEGELCERCAKFLVDDGGGSHL